MKGQRVNPNNLNPMEMNNMSTTMGMMNSIQKIGKGKRKYKVSLTKNEKKFLGKFIVEVKKQFGDETNTPYKNVFKFFNYIEKYCGDKNAKDLSFSFEELEFLKRVISESITGMKSVSFKWYQLIKKVMVKSMLVQYAEVLKKLKI